MIPIMNIIHTYKYHDLQKVVILIYENKVPERASKRHPFEQHVTHQPNKSCNGRTISNQQMWRGFASPTFVKIYHKTFEGSSWATTTKGVETLTQDANLIRRDGLNDLAGWSCHFFEWHYKSEIAQSCLKRTTWQQTRHTFQLWPFGTRHGRYNRCHFNIHCIQGTSEWHPLYLPVTSKWRQDLLCFSPHCLSCKNVDFVVGNLISRCDKFANSYI